MTSLLILFPLFVMYDGVKGESKKKTWKMNLLGGDLEFLTGPDFQTLPDPTDTRNGITKSDSTF